MHFLFASGLMSFLVAILMAVLCYVSLRQEKLKLAIFDFVLMIVNITFAIVDFITYK